MKNNKYTVVIIDDEQICIDTIRHSIAEEYPDLLIVGVAHTPQAGRKIILEHRPDLLFIDVEMQGQTGLELLNTIRERITWSMQVVFHTAYEKYLLDALRASAFDFLLKPYSDDDFREAMSRFFKAVIQAKADKSFEDTLSQLLPVNSVFIISTISGYQMVRIEQIVYFQYQNSKRLWEIILADKTHHLLKRDTTANDILNNSSSLIQINQHQIINIHYLSTIEGRNCRLLPPFNVDIKLECISRKFMTKLEEKFKLI
ncbi:MAG: LytR/AlgR family response regulator transcription factor [Bacteroidales bacterium]